MKLISEFYVFEDRKEGWTYPPRGKKAHYFINGVSLCEKYKYKTDSSLMKALLPTSTFFTNELCKKCLQRFKDNKYQRTI